MSALLSQLIQDLGSLPGIGPKSAQRMAYHLLSQPREKSRALVESIHCALEGIGHCKKCHQFSEEELCQTCRDPRRNPEQVCVVESSSNVFAIEKSGAFSGLYHVLGGTLSPLDGIGPEDIELSSLLQRVKEEGVKEVILALGGSADADSTALFIEQALKGNEIRLTRLARGIPVGADLEYLDERTLFSALESRTQF